MFDHRIAIIHFSLLREQIPISARSGYRFEPLLPWHSLSDRPLLFNNLDGQCPDLLSEVDKFIDIVLLGLRRKNYAFLNLLPVMKNSLRVRLVASWRTKRLPDRSQTAYSLVKVTCLLHYLASWAGQVVQILLESFLFFPLVFFRLHGFGSQVFKVKKRNLGWESFLQFLGDGVIEASAHAEVFAFLRHFLKLAHSLFRWCSVFVLAVQ